MTKATLLLIACLAEKPDRCERFEVVMERCVLPMEAWQAAVRWGLEHPAWRLRRIEACAEGLPA